MKRYNRRSVNTEAHGTLKRSAAQALQTPECRLLCGTAQLPTLQPLQGALQQWEPLHKLRPNMRPLQEVSPRLGPQFRLQQQSCHGLQHQLLHRPDCRHRLDLDCRFRHLRLRHLPTTLRSGRSRPRSTEPGDVPLREGLRLPRTSSLQTTTEEICSTTCLTTDHLQDRRKTSTGWAGPSTGSLWAPRTA